MNKTSFSKDNVLMSVVLVTALAMIGAWGVTEEVKGVTTAATSSLTKSVG